MQPRWSLSDAVPRLGAPLRLAPVRRTPLRLAAVSLAAAAVALAAAGCGHSSGTSATGSATHSSAPATVCGTARTAANVPVRVEVTRGQVSCPHAMTVEHDYAKAIQAGQAPGNGGGGPVNVSGWQCQGFPTPQVLKTGWASKCTKNGAEILAVLPSPT